MKNLAAADIDVGKLRGFGTLGLGDDPSGFFSADIFNNFLSTLIGVMTMVGIIWFVIQIIMGAVGIIGSGGDKAKLAEAKSKITSSLIGLVVVISAVFLIDLIGNIFGLPYVLNPGQFIICIGSGSC